MEKYLILNRTLAGIGGAEIYTRNKIEFLRKHKFFVSVFSALQGEIYINDLKCYEKNIIPELLFAPSLFSESERDRIIQPILDYITEPVVIESHTIEMALWAELICHRTQSKNFVFLMDDDFPTYSDEVYDFLLFKLDRKELACIAPGAAKLLFKAKYPNNMQYDFSLPAVCTNSIEDIPCELPTEINFEEFNLRIGTISRLEKRSVPLICHGIKQFCLHHADFRVLYVLFGGSSNPDIIRRINKFFSEISNIKIVITGFIYPIPLQFVKKMDVFISVAGAARVTASEGCITLTLDQDTGVPFGILGYNTMATQYPIEGDSPCGWNSIEMALEEIFVKNAVSIHKLHLGDQKNDYNKLFISHMTFIENSDRNKYYFDIGRVTAVALCRRWVYRISKVLLLLFGVKKFIIIYNTTIRILNLKGKYK